MANFDGTDAFFDSRDVIERISELESFETLSDDEGEEIAALYDLRDEAETAISDWQYGETFHTHESLTEYAEEISTEFGYLSTETPTWITDNIDWDGVADALKEDYQEFEFRGTTYYAR